MPSASQLLLVATGIMVLTCVAVSGMLVYDLIVGSYKRYADKRALHLEQLRRVEGKIEKGNRDGD
jgi:hypothetical protein